MLTSKQRSYLRGQANGLSDIVHIGKDGFSENIVKQVRDALEARELIKGKIQQNSLEDARQIGARLAEEAGAELVCTIGNKFVLFKQKKKDSAFTL